MLLNPAKFQNLLRTLRRQPSLKDVAEKLKTAYESQLEVDGRETELKSLSYCKSSIFGYLYDYIIGHNTSLISQLDSINSIL